MGRPCFFSAMVHRFLFLGPDRPALLITLSHLADVLLLFPGSSRGGLHIRVSDAPTPIPTPVLLPPPPPHRHKATKHTLLSLLFRYQTTAAK